MRNNDAAEPCPLCGGCSFRHLLDYSARGYDRRLVKCRGCGLTRGDPIRFGERENAEFHSGWVFDDEGTRLPVIAEIVRLVKSSATLQGTGVRLLDVGCGTGKLLELARRVRFEPVGVELSEDAARLAAERTGLEVWSGTVRAQAFPPAAFDIVVASEVIYYSSDPVVELAEYARILSDGGLLVLALLCNRWTGVFALCSGIHRIFRGGAYRIGKSRLSRAIGEWGTFSANYQFSTSTIKRALKRGGFRILALQNQRSHERKSSPTVRDRLFSLYRLCCMFCEQVTFGWFVLGPTIHVVATPVGRRSRDTGDDE